MGFERFVEIGRVGYVAFGPDEGKLVAIIDCITQNHVLVDGPGIQRKSLNLKMLHLTKFVLKISNNCRPGIVKKAWEKAEIEKKWAETTWAKKLAAKKLRQTLSDFDRFKLMKAKQARNRLITSEFGRLQAKAKKAGPVKSKRKPNKKPHKRA